MGNKDNKNNGSFFRANEQQKNNCELKIVDESDENIVFSNRYIFISVGIEPLK